MLYFTYGVSQGGNLAYDYFQKEAAEKAPVRSEEEKIVIKEAELKFRAEKAKLKANREHNLNMIQLKRKEEEYLSNQT